MKTWKQYPPGPENLKVLVEDLVRDYKRDHPEEEEDLDVFPPKWYGPLDKGGPITDGMLKIGRSMFVIRGNKVEKEIRSPETPPWVQP